MLNKEREKGGPLTQEEVERIRDNAPCIAMTPEQRRAVDEGRQYDDIDPEFAWEEWQVARTELSTKEAENK
ncbi:MAG: hypothetical protein ACFB21_03680 [Opitutales bacterium]